VLPDRNSKQALDYLRGVGRLAVIPSLMENSASTVLECLLCQVPFLASRVGGTSELIAAEDVDRVCFEPKLEVLVQRLLEALRHGHAPARLSFDPERNNAAWVRWHEELGGSRAPAAPTKYSLPAGAPTVSACITHRGEPRGLRDAVASLRDQVRPP